MDTFLVDDFYFALFSSSVLHAAEPVTRFCPASRGALITFMAVTVNSLPLGVLRVGLPISDDVLHVDFKSAPRVSSPRNPSKPFQALAILLADSYSMTSN